MSWSLWIMYCVISAGIFLYPSRSNLMVAQHSAMQGPSSGLIVAFGAAIGLAVSMTIASFLLITVLVYTGPLNSVFGWLGVSWLILTALWTFGTVPFRAAQPDNDNIASKIPLVNFAQAFTQHAANLKFFGFFLCLLAQFCLAPKAITGSDFIELQIATFCLAFSCLAAIAIYPNITISWLRDFGRKVAKRRPANKAIIAGKSVKARYRKIAA